MQVEIELDIDRNRIKTILLETYNACKEMLAVEFSVTQGDFVESIEPYIACNRIATKVLLNLPSSLYPGLQIEVDLRRSKVFARIPSRIRYHPKQVLLNRFLKGL